MPKTDPSNTTTIIQDVRMGDKNDFFEDARVLITLSYDLNAVSMRR